MVSTWDKLGQTIGAVLLSTELSCCEILRHGQHANTGRGRRPKLRQGRANHHLVGPCIVWPKYMLASHGIPAPASILQSGPPGPLFDDPRGPNENQPDPNSERLRIWVRLVPFGSVWVRLGLFGPHLGPVCSSARKIWFSTCDPQRRKPGNASTWGLQCMPDGLYSNPGGLGAVGGVRYAPARSNVAPLTAPRSPKCNPSCGAS